MDDVEVGFRRPCVKSKVRNLSPRLDEDKGKHEVEGDEAHREDDSGGNLTVVEILTAAKTLLPVLTTRSTGSRISSRTGVVIGSG